jgi:hypothetical protein
VNGEPDTQLLDEISQQFLRAVKLSMGADKSAEVMAALEGPMGKAWKDRVILHKLSGTYQTTNKISFRLVDPERYRAGSNDVSFKIKAIKEVRAMTGFGLAQAKKVVEDAELLTQVVELTQFERNEQPMVWERKMMQGIDLLRQCGFEVNYA